MFVCLPVCLSICLSVCLFFCLSVYLSVYLSDCQSVFLGAKSLRPCWARAKCLRSGRKESSGGGKVSLPLWGRCKESSPLLDGFIKSLSLFGGSKNLCHCWAGAENLRPCLPGAENLSLGNAGNQFSPRVQRIFGPCWVDAQNLCSLGRGQRIFAPVGAGATEHLVGG
jgi:hypothetical protein